MRSKSFPLYPSSPLSSRGSDGSDIRWVAISLLPHVIFSADETEKTCQVGSMMPDLQTSKEILVNIHDLTPNPASGVIVLRQAG